MRKLDERKTDIVIAPLHADTLKAKNFDLNSKLLDLPLEGGLPDRNRLSHSLQVQLAILECSFRSADLPSFFSPS